MAVYTTFVDLPGGTFSQSSTPSTAPLQINGKSVGRELSGLGVPSLLDSDIAKVIWMQNNGLSEAKALRLSLAIGSIKNIYEHRQPTYSNRPIPPGHKPKLNKPDDGKISWVEEN